MRCSQAHAEPYSVNRSRNGRGGSASGPRTPEPDQAPESISSTGDPGQCRADPARTYQQDAHGLILDLAAHRPTRPVVYRIFYN